jgi:hypothetical protein
LTAVLSLLTATVAKPDRFSWQTARPLVAYNSDEHINDLIRRSLETNPTAHVFAFLYGSLDGDPYKQAKECAFSTPNLSVLAFDKGIIGRVEGEWSGSDDPTSFSLPTGIVVTDASTKVCELKLGDFMALGDLLKNLTAGVADDDH